MRRARHRVESLQMAPISWRDHSLVRALVPEVSDLICSQGRDGTGRWSVHPLQLHLALGPNLRPELDKRCRAHLKRTNRFASCRCYPAKTSFNPPPQLPRLFRLNGRAKTLFEAAEPSVKRPHG